MVILACFYYMIIVIDWPQTINSFAKANIPLLMLAVFMKFASVAAISAMIRFISGAQAGYYTSFVAITISNALNLILPAKLGEGAKIYILARETPATSGKIVEWIFWERFFLLNALLAIMVFGIGNQLNQETVLLLSFCLLCLWGVVGLVWWHPEKAINLSKKLKFPQARNALIDFIQTLISRRSISFFIGITLFSIGYLAMEVSVVTLCLWATGIKISIADSLCVFSAAMLGFLIPASPGAIGVFEVAVATSLEWMGVSKAQGIPSAVILHAVYIAPIALSTIPILPKVIAVFRIRKDIGLQQKKKT